MMPTQKYTFKVTMTFELEIESSSPRQAESDIDGRIDELIHGTVLSQLIDDTGNYETEMIKNGAEEELEQNLDWIDTYQPFCLQGDADRYHIACAKEVYRWHAVKALLCRDRGIDELDKRYPEDNEGNPLHVIYGYEWAQDARNAMANKESVYDSCGFCLNTLYNEPKKEEEDK